MQVRSFEKNFKNYVKVKKFLGELPIVVIAIKLYSENN